ncbi:thioesterase family protein [soil metagenome]
MAAAPVPALFSPSGEGFAAASMTRGPWDAVMMHGSAPSALLAHAIEQVLPGDELAVARLTIEFLGGVPVGDVSVQTSLAKPGKRFQIVDATLQAGERVACMARAVRLRQADMPGAQVSADGVQPLAPPAEGDPLAQWDIDAGDELFYPRATEIRHVGGKLGSGHAAAWIRLRGELLPGVTPSPLVRAVVAADFANGLSWILPIDAWLFVNTELTVHLHREPAGEWIGLDARTAIGPNGIGLSTGVLHDLDGPFGVCAESLFVERRQAAGQS